MDKSELLKDMSPDVRALNSGALGFVFTGTKEPRGSKYHNIKTNYAGRTFDSGKEAARAQELQTLEKGGAIFNLGYQIRFPLAGGIIYVADFVYLDEHLEPVIEDVKGFKTDVYRLKKKLFKEKYNLTISEV
jgi:hypothetical protein